MRCCLRKPLRQDLTACLMDVTRPELTSVHTSGGASPPLRAAVLTCCHCKPISEN
ncbi:MAG: hypothetical protein FWG87_06195 [Defluviitaleaceae bacterium]|nr:hypothetical protein [Defluviitaleaceae bacterium]